MLSILEAGRWIMGGAGSAGRAGPRRGTRCRRPWRRRDFAWVGVLAPAALHAQRGDAFPGHENRDGQQHRDVAERDDLVDLADGLELLDELRADLRPDDGPDDHDAAEFQVHVSQRPVTLRADDRFADDVREVRAHGEVRRHAHEQHRRPGEKTAAHAEESAQHPDDESHRHEQVRVEVRAGNEEIHAAVLVGFRANETQ